jgi:hypothetical protein
MNQKYLLSWAQFGKESFVKWLKLRAIRKDMSTQHTASTTSDKAVKILDKQCACFYILCSEQSSADGLVFETNKGIAGFRDCFKTLKKYYQQQQAAQTSCAQPDECLRLPSSSDEPERFRCSFLNLSDNNIMWESNHCSKTFRRNYWQVHLTPAKKTRLFCLYLTPRMILITILSFC